MFGDWRFEHEEGIEKAKRIIIEIAKKGSVLLFLFGVIFLPAKIFYFNNPKLTPDEIAVLYLKAEQDLIENSAEEYILSDTSKVKILESEYGSSRWAQKEKQGDDPIFEIEKTKIEKETAKISVLQKTGKKQGWIFYNFYLPEQLVFRISLEKEGNWKSGYEWRVARVDSSDLIFKNNIGQKAEVEKGIFATLVNVEEYKKGTNDLASGTKVYSLEVEYKNESLEKKYISPFGSWGLKGKDGKIISPPPQTSAYVLRQPVLFGGELSPGKSEKGFIVFYCAKDFYPQEIIFGSMEKKIIFSLSN